MSKERMNVSVSKPTVRRTDHLVATGQYRNRSHVAEAGINALYEASLVDQPKRKKS